jgi:AcrR family transcriptional regulator
MGLDPAPWDEMSDEERKAEIKRRQRLGIQYVNDQRKSKTRAKLEVAVQELQREGEKITQRAVAARSGCSTKTVNSHWPSLL